MNELAGSTRCFVPRGSLAARAAETASPKSSAAREVHESREPKIVSEELLPVYKDNYSYLQQDRIVLNSKTAVSVTKVQPSGEAEI